MITNNQIVIATAQQKIDHNGNVKADIIKRIAVLTHGTDFIKQQTPATIQRAATAQSTTASSDVVPTAGTDAHEAEKFGLVFALVAIGLLALWL